MLVVIIIVLIFFGCGWRLVEVKFNFKMWGCLDLFYIYIWVGYID